MRRLCRSLAVTIFVATCCAIAVAPVQSFEKAVWELHPYQIKLLLVHDGSPAWSEARLQQLADQLRQRAAAEIGAAWQLQVVPAPNSFRRTVLGWDERRDPPLRPPGEYLSGSDKVMFLVLRAAEGTRTLEVREFDCATRRWGPACRAVIDRWSDVPRAAFDVVCRAFSPIALIKKVGDRRVIVRPRAALLPTPNRRRIELHEGSVFFVAVRAAGGGPYTGLPTAYLVAEKMDDQGVTCRPISRFHERLGRAQLDRWIAVGMRPTQAATDYALSMSSEGSRRPLVGCTIEVHRESGGDVVYRGRSDGEGRVVVRRAGGVCWMRISQRGVPLDAVPVVPGWRNRREINTRVTPEMLDEAAALADCRDAVAELVAQCGVLAARARFRTKAGRQDADELWDQRKKLIKQVEPALRQRLNRLHGSSERRFERQWAELGAALDALQREKSRDESPAKKPAPAAGQ